MLREQKITSMLPTPHPTRKVISFVGHFLINVAWALPWAVGVLFIAHRVMGLSLDLYIDKVMRDIISAMESLTLNHI